MLSQICWLVVNAGKYRRHLVVVSARHILWIVVFIYFVLSSVVDRVRRWWRWSLVMSS